MARDYAPALTKQQFKGIRPGGNYQNYLNYLERKRPGWKAPQALRPQHMPPPMRGPSYTQNLLLRRLQILTPQQMEAQANRMAQTQMKYQKSMLADEYKQAQEDAMRRMLAFQAAGRTAAAMNASLIGQVGGQYQAGADQLSQMAAGGAAQMAQATQGAVEAANAASANVGMPGVTVGGPVGQPGVAGATQAGVESYRGGTLPAQALQNAGGYAQAGMAGQISAQNLRATQEAQAAYMQAMGEAGQARSSAMKALVAGRPDVAMKYLAQLQDNQRQAIALASSMVGAEFQQGMTKKEFQQGVKQQKVENDQWQQTFDAQQDALNAKITAEADANNIEMSRVDASASRAWGYLVNKRGEFILGKNKQPIRVASYSGAGGKGKTGLTLYQTNRMMEKADAAAQRAFEGKTDSRGNVTGTLTWSQTIGKLRAMGLTTAQAQAVASNYYTQPGADGRPAFVPQQKAWGKKKYGALFERAQRVIDQLNNGDDEEGFAIADRIREAILNGATPTQISQLVLEGKKLLG